MSKNQFPWMDALVHRVVNSAGDSLYVYENTICGLDFRDADEFLEEVRNCCSKYDENYPHPPTNQDLQGLRKEMLPALGALLSIDNVCSAPLWDCDVEPVVEIGEVFWIAEAKSRAVQSQILPRTLQMDAAVQVLYTTACGVFKEVLDAHPGAKVIIELRSALILCQDSMQRTTPELARRLCRAIVTLLTKDRVEVPRQQGSPELSEALERVVNLLKPPNDTQWTQDEYQAVKSGLVSIEKPPIGLD